MDLSELKEKAAIVKQAFYSASSITEDDLVSMTLSGTIDLYELYSRAKAIECLEKLATFKKEAFRKYASSTGYTGERDYIARVVASAVPRGVTNNIQQLIYDLRPVPVVSPENMALNKLVELLKD
ncbi:MAG: hypothetical protein ABIM22_07720 [candidate division WOR-3 bacterium]